MKLFLRNSNKFKCKMAEHNELGKKGEELAVAHLEQNGYLILETNTLFKKPKLILLLKKTMF